MSDLKNFEKPKQPELAKHDSTILDLAFVMDCTGSMGSYIQNATESIRQIVEEIVALEKSDVKLALVEYRDHPPQERTFVTRTHDFTESVKEMKKWLEGCSAEGGGDTPEAVADGLQDALKLSWRNKATKICVLISDAPPHGLSASGDNFKNGCPLGIDPMKVVHQMAEKGITLYSVGCEPAITPYKEFFSAIAFTTGGQYVPLRNAKLLAKVIVGGAVEEISLEKLMEEVQEEVRLQQECGVLDEKELASAVESKLRSKGAQVYQMKMNNTKLEKVSEKAMKYSKISSLSEINREYESAESKDSTVYKAAAPEKTKSMFGRVLGAFSHMKKAPPRAAAAASSRVLTKESEEFSEPASSVSSFAPATDVYTVVNDDIQTEQIERLVQKAIKRNNKI